MITKKSSKRFLGFLLVVAISILATGCPSPFGYFATQEDRAAQYETNETAPPESVATPYILLSSGGAYAASSFDFSGTVDGNLGTYQGLPVAHDIKLATQTEGADIYYTTDGSNITPNSGTTKKFNPAEPIHLTGDGSSVFIKAMGLKTLHYPSPVSNIGVKIQWNTTAQPVFAANGSTAGLSPDGVNSFNAPVNITISTSDGSTVYYVMSSSATGVQPLPDTGVVADDVLNHASKQTYSGAISIPAGEYRKIWAVSAADEKISSPASVNAFEFAVRPAAPAFSVSNPLGNLSGVPVLAVYQGDDNTGAATSYSLAFGGAATEVRLTTDGSDPSSSTGSGTALSGGATTVVANTAQWSTHIGSTMTIKARQKVAGVDVWSQTGQITVRVIEATQPKPPTVVYVDGSHISFVPSETGNNVYWTLSTSTSTAPPAVQIPDDLWNNANITLPTTPGNYKKLRVVEARPWATTPTPSDDRLFEFAVSLNSTNIGTLKFVPAGRFQRDSNPANVSSVSAFFMNVYEITRDQFATFMGIDPSNAGVSENMQAPVNRILWYHAIAFANKVSIAEGLTPVYAVSGVNFSTLAFSAIPTTDDATWSAATADWNANGYRLPTEMEWMWASMGAPVNGQGGATNTDGYAKPFAGSDGSNNLDDYAWYYPNASSIIHQVGTKLPNELGLYDMSGNAFEWIWDRTDAWPNGLLADYHGDTGSYNILLSGSYLADAQWQAVHLRLQYNPTAVYSEFGFRLVRKP